MRGIDTAWVVAFVVAGATGVTGCKSAPAPKRAPATPVRVATVARIDAPLNILASGIVEPVQTVSVTAQVSGSLLDVLFKEGDFVQKGQVLFRIDPRPTQAALDQARAVLARDQAQLDAGQKDDARYAKLADMGYVSRSQADQMHATAMAQAATVAADRAAVRSAEVDLGYTTIRAPIAGRTGSVLVRRGNNVSPGSTPLVVINQISPVLVRFPVLDQDFAAVQRSVALHPLHVSATSSDSSTVTDNGELSFLDNAVDSTTGTVTGKATFPNTARRLWPGQLVFLTVQLDVEHNALAVPTEAIQTGQQGTYVFVVAATKKVQSRAVSPGIVVGDMTVVQKGLAAGETVVIDGQSKLNTGSTVAILGNGTDTSGTTLPGSTSQGTAAGDIVTGRAGASGSAAVTGASGASGAGSAAPLPAVPSARGAATVAGTAPTTPATPTTAPTNPTTTTPTTTPPTTGTPTTSGRPPGDVSRARR
ncbi:MAG TPA: efflux RND transporter periplasmic adaptor subunit [Gemmatimonadaceae bacterium]|jgi:multidrug efflux system membrane fusion protein